jgi:hypothetical protein
VPAGSPGRRDDMIMAMEEGREVDILQEIMKYSGLESGEH